MGNKWVTILFESGRNISLAQPSSSNTTTCYGHIWNWCYLTNGCISALFKFCIFFRSPAVKNKPNASNETHDLCQKEQDSFKTFANCTTKHTARQMGTVVNTLPDKSHRENLLSIKQRHFFPSSALTPMKEHSAVQDRVLCISRRSVEKFSDKTLCEYFIVAKLGWLNICKRFTDMVFSS